MFKNRNKDKFKRSSSYNDNISYSSIATKESEGTVHDGLSVKAMSGLPHSSYSIQADPYTSANSTSTPYNVLAKFNKKIGGKYKGLQNLDGGNTQQYANSTLSGMLNYFDIFRLRTEFNYRFRPTRLSAVPSSTGPDDPYIGSGLIDQCRQAISEATSVLKSTTYTQMNINNYVIVTDMAMGTATRKKMIVPEEVDDSGTVYAYTNQADVIYAALSFYQITIQEILNYFNWFNSFRLKQGSMIRSSWNRETPALNSLFGLFNKKSFLSTLDSIAMGFPGEYVDTEWARQMNMLNSVPSRRSNAFTDPILELQTRAVHPSVFKMYYVDSNGDIIAKVFDAADDFTKTMINVGSGTTIEVSLWDAVEEASNLLSAESIMHWARNNVQVTADADTAYFNSVKFRNDVIQLCLTTFKTKFNDIREVLDTLSRTGVVSWVKGFRPSITKDTDAQLFDNQLVNDIFTMAFGGANKVVFNNKTKRWRTFALWNMYSGIPEYDAYSGGAFLSLSAKDVVYDSDEDETFKYLPILYFYDDSITDATNANGTKVSGTNRLGTQVFIKTKVVPIRDNNIFRRLAPLPSQSDLEIRTPVLASGGDSLNDDSRSCLYKQLTQLFGSCGLAMTTSSLDYSLDPDIIAVYQYEIEDITNEAIAYARATGPFRGSDTFVDKIGFSSFGS